MVRAPKALARSPSLGIRPQSEKSEAVVEDLVNGRMLDQGDYAQFVSYVIDTHIPSETAQSLVNDYATRFAASGWKGLTAEDFSDLRTKYTGRLSPQVMDTLEKWVTTEVYPRMRAQRQAGGRS